MSYPIKRLARLLEKVGKQVASKIEKIFTKLRKKSTKRGVKLGGIFLWKFTKEDI